jgi:transcriptional regulator with XRE-family HTH domain
MKTIDQKMKGMSSARRKKIEARAAHLITEEMTLQEIRRALKITQIRMAKVLGISQDGVSRLEKRSDLLLSTLRKTVEAMGGNLSLIAQFPELGPIELLGIATIDPKPANRRKHAHSHS